MKTVVCVKQVRTLGDEVEFTGDERDVDPDYVELAVNEWDTYAVEEALRVKEATGEGEVVVVTVGGDEAEEALRRCLAMGADRAIRVESEGAGVEDPLTTARRLAAAVAPESPDLVFTGVQSSDSVQAATGTMLAAFAGPPPGGGRDEARVRPRRQAGDRRPRARGRAHRHRGSGHTGGSDDPDRDQRTALRHASCHQAGQSTGDRRPGRCVGGEPAYRVRRMFVPPRARGQNRSAIPRPWSQPASLRSSRRGLS